MGKISLIYAKKPFFLCRGLNRFIFAPKDKCWTTRNIYKLKPKEIRIFLISSFPHFHISANPHIPLFRISAFPHLVFTEILFI